MMHSDVQALLCSFASEYLAPPPTFLLLVPCSIRIPFNFISSTISSTNNQIPPTPNNPSEFGLPLCLDLFLPSFLPFLTPCIHANLLLSPPHPEPSDGDLHGRLPALSPEHPGGHPLPASHLDRWHSRDYGVSRHRGDVLHLCKYTLGNILILFRYCDMRLDFVLDFGYRVVIWHKCFPGFKGCITVK